MNKRMKNCMLLIAFGVALYACLNNFGSVIRFFQDIGGLLLPIIGGMIVAFVLNVPVKGFETLYSRLFRKINFQPKNGPLVMLSLLSTLACIVLIVILVSTMVVPQLISSVRSVYLTIQTRSPQWIAFLSEYGFDTTWITKQLSSLSLSQIDVEHIVQNVLTGAGNFLSSALGIATSTISIIVNCFFSLVIALYILLSKKTLGRQCKKLLYVHVRKPIADCIYHVATLISKTYSKFLSGQCIEAIILGVLIFISFTIFRIPYAVLIAVLTGVLSFIPYIGAFFACFIGAVLVLMVNPLQALLSIIVYQVVQFIENQFIYPHVVGGSVGLAPLWTLVAVLIGGNLFGILGMIFFIPLVAVLYQLVKEYTNKKQAMQQATAAAAANAAQKAKADAETK
ncbi:MAG TPA: AI-2E family transporter [Candidatus Anaerobutyricum stercoris]|uniref:AI-2E family transporter n=1 Tax=Candidatus Anaerobutyricum stercoris TaxID=2838457 RepID=A0A9D2J843_9FIRM|nr:AI-2E family transporter [Candidatus Anaerobutyricum stercoris]